MQHRNGYRSGNRTPLLVSVVAASGLVLGGCAGDQLTATPSATESTSTSAAPTTQPCRYDPTISASDYDCVASAKLPDIGGKQADKALVALKDAGFTNVSLADGSGTDGTVSDESQWKVSGVADDSDAALSYGTSVKTNAAIELQLVPVHPCEFDETIPAGTDTCAAADPDDHIVYTVTGGSAASVTYSAGGLGSAEQATGVGLPWTKKIDVPSGTMDFLYVSAQNAGGGTITCEITRNGERVTKHTSSGQYAIVTCSG